MSETYFPLIPISNYAHWVMCNDLEQFLRWNDQGRRMEQVSRPLLAIWLKMNFNFDDTSIVYIYVLRLFSFHDPSLLSIEKLFFSSKDIKTFWTTAYDNIKTKTNNGYNSELIAVPSNELSSVTIL